MIKTSIKCPCGSKDGEYLGKIKVNKEEFNLNKCLKCKQQIKTKVSEGMNYA